MKVVFSAVHLSSMCLSFHFHPSLCLVQRETVVLHKWLKKAIKGGIVLVALLIQDLIAASLCFTL